MSVAVILSGCGAYDGSEIHEATLTLLHLQKQGLAIQCYAPDHTFTPKNHLTQEIQPASRHILTEAARIARGNILPLTKVLDNDHNAAVFPGGFGAASHLCDFTDKGTQCTVLTEVKNLITHYHAHKKPLGFICIAPILAAALIPKVTLTIGTDPTTIEQLKTMGANPVPCFADQIAIDEKNLILSTPDYMLAKQITEVDQGIEKLCHQLAQWIQ